MELLDLLESKVTDMLGAMENLRAENSRLAEELAALAVSRDEIVALLEEENKNLSDALAEERRIKEAVLARIDGVLAKLGGQN